MFPGQRKAGNARLWWILGGVAFVMMAAVSVVAVLIFAAARADTEPAAKASAVGPKLEPAPTALFDAGSRANPKPTEAPIVNRPPPLRTSTVASSRTGIAPTRTAVPSSSASIPRPFPRALADARADQVLGGLGSCKQPSGPFGAGSVTVTFDPDGRVRAVARAPFSGTAEGTCITTRFLGATVGAFEGTPQTVERTFVIQD